MTETFKAKRPAEFLVALPRMLGYAPVESIVVQTFQSRRTAATLRIDIPTEKADPRHVADALVRLVSRVPGVDAVLIAVYSDELWRGALPPKGELIERIVTRLASAGLGIIDALCSSETRWASYLDDESGSLAELIDSPLYSDLSNEIGASADPSLRRQGAEAIEPGEAAVRADVVLHAGSITEDTEERERLWQWVCAGQLWADAIETTPTDLPAPVVAALLWSIRDKATRDCVLMSLAWGRPSGDRAAGDTERLHRGVPVPAGSILETFVGEGRSGPSGLRLEGAIRLLRYLVSLAPAPWTPAPLTMLAWCEWARGHGSAAGDYIDGALDIAPGYELARLFRDLIAAGRVPEWVGRAPL
ncbi:DUF4192 domain-containing protein [Agreia sp. COWG]|uniref:DUF4192 domain-containing protein n=1 Tax=Agreia sp. COWG TaxID=2773266 RepID=UPI001928D3E1|nr:DUF4192 domain-containing protein [Agreia sp. COWG]CAD6000328.1 conserved protein of unknown function [Agreia sp. COWG]